MSSKKFTIEVKKTFVMEDLSIARNLYIPVVGINAISLYELLIDYHLLNKYNRSFFPLSDLQKTLNISYDHLFEAKMKLEAVGLLRTFEKANNELFIFALNKPLNPIAFRNNSLLYKQYLKMASEEMFERFEFSNNSFTNNKDDYKEITIKFQDMFDINLTNKQNTIELNIPLPSNRDEAIKGLTTMQFVKFLTNKAISPAFMSISQNLQKIGFSSASINEIASYSYEVNGKIVARHVNKIATDLFEKNITSSNQIKTELSHAFESRIPTKSPFVEEDNSLKKHDLEWEDIFNELGEF